MKSKEKPRIRQLGNSEKTPYDLLLLADETTEAINRYIFKSEIYILELENKAIALYAFYVLNKEDVEIKNIAVAKEYQRQGMGRLLLKDAVDRARSRGFRRVIIGTGDVSTMPMHFYQKEGFEVFSVKKNFFTDNYPDPIYEKGVRLIDMVMLKKDV